MAGLCKVTLIGNLGAKPEMRYTPDGVAVTDFSVACSDSKKADDVLWFRVSCWRSLADLANKYLDKGRQVYVEGRLRHRSYTKRDGSEGCGLDVIADKVVFLGRKAEGSLEESAENGTEGGENGWPGEEGEEDLADRKPPTEASLGVA